MGKTIAIITAGGSGERFKSKIRKQFIELNNRPVLFWTLDEFVTHELIDQVLVVLPQEQMSFCREIKKEYPLADISCLEGGKERQDSVYNALRSCPESTDLVMIHDGVRPFISAAEISALYGAVQKWNAVIAVSKIANTIKAVTEDRIERTVPRENLYNALTPQVFKYNLILEYHEKARKEGLYFTDDSAILEHYEQKVHILECSSGNIKITSRDDLKLAGLIMEKK